jgi:hypothetical protein
MLESSAASSAPSANEPESEKAAKRVKAAADRQGSGLMLKSSKTENGTQSLRGRITPCRETPLVGPDRARAGRLRSC